MHEFLHGWGLAGLAPIGGSGLDLLGGGDGRGWPAGPPQSGLIKTGLAGGRGCRPIRVVRADQGVRLAVGRGCEWWAGQPCSLLG